jgi:WD40 repeat protein
MAGAWRRQAKIAPHAFGDAATGQVLTPPLHHADTVRQIVFSPDGLRVATGSTDGTARVWDLLPDLGAVDPMLLAQALAARKLDETGALTFLSASEFQDVWNQVRRDR